MPGYLYAVIFDQGTTKVGLTRNKNPSTRTRMHYSEGAKWGVKVKYELVVDFGHDGLEFKELSLCGYCERFASSVSAYEWFKFNDPEHAKSKIEEFFGKILNNEFGTIQCRSVVYPVDKPIRFEAAMSLIKSGMNPNDAAKMVGLHPRSVNQKKEFKVWKEQTEKEQQMKINGVANA